MIPVEDFEPEIQVLRDEVAEEKPDDVTDDIPDDMPEDAPNDIPIDNEAGNLLFLAFLY